VLLASRIALFFCVLIGLAGLLLAACFAVERALTVVANRYQLTDAFLRFVIARQRAARAGLPTPSPRETELERAHDEARDRARALERALDAIASKSVLDPAEYARVALALRDDTGEEP